MDLTALIQSLGVHIKMESGKLIGHLTIFSCYHPHPPEIILYPNVIETHGKIKNLNYYLAHELFHHLEAIGRIKVPEPAREPLAHHFAIRLLQDETDEKASSRRPYARLGNANATQRVSFALSPPRSSRQ